MSAVLQEEEKPGPSSSKKKKTPFSPTPDKRRNVTGPATSTPRVTKRRKVSEGRITLILRIFHILMYVNHIFYRGLLGHDWLVVGFTTTCAFSAYHQ